MKVGIVKEIHPGECKVAATPDTVSRFIKLGFNVFVEENAGFLSGFPNEAYEKAGATIEKQTVLIWSTSEIILKVRPPEFNTSLNHHECDLIREGGTLASFIWPSRNKELLNRFKNKNITVFALDMVPRITRAQKMDALSALSNIAGYRAVIEAANYFGRFFTGQITAAGKVPPAKVLVIGAGVAGLSAIGASRGLGAIVRAFDTRLEVKDQVKSMGADFLELSFKEDGTGAGGYAKTASPEFLAAEMKLFQDQAKDVDIIITTALVPGTKAPLLINRSMISVMKPGSVIVDLAAEQGGNCELTQPGKTISVNGITIVGENDLPSKMANTASLLLSMNLFYLIQHLWKDNLVTIDMNDSVTRGCLVTYNREITWPPPRIEDPTPKKQTTEIDKPKKEVAHTTKPSFKMNCLFMTLFIVALLIIVTIGIFAPAKFVSHLTVFILSCVLGWLVIWNVKPALHTPLMSVTNAISGIIVIGGMLQLTGSESSITSTLALIAILIATINICGGFLVTQRMLKMFRKG